MPGRGVYMRMLLSYTALSMSWVSWHDGRTGGDY